MPVVPAGAALRVGLMVGLLGGVTTSLTGVGIDMKVELSWSLWAFIAFNLMAASLGFSVLYRVGRDASLTQ